MLELETPLLLEQKCRNITYKYFVRIYEIYDRKLKGIKRLIVKT